MILDHPCFGTSAILHWNPEWLNRTADELVCGIPESIRLHLSGKLLRSATKAKIRSWKSGEWSPMPVCLAAASPALLPSCGAAQQHVELENHKPSLSRFAGMWHAARSLPHSTVWSPHI